MVFWCCIHHGASLPRVSEYVQRTYDLGSAFHGVDLMASWMIHHAPHSMFLLWVDYGHHRKVAFGDGCKTVRYTPRGNKYDIVFELIRNGYFTKALAALQSPFFKLLEHSFLKESSRHVDVLAAAASEMNEVYGCDVSASVISRLVCELRHKSAHFYCMDCKLADHILRGNSFKIMILMNEIFNGNFVNVVATNYGVDKAIGILKENVYCSSCKEEAQTKADWLRRACDKVIDAAKEENDKKLMKAKIEKKMKRKQNLQLKHEQEKKDRDQRRKEIEDQKFEEDVQRRAREREKAEEAQKQMEELRQRAEELERKESEQRRREEAERKAELARRAEEKRLAEEKRAEFETRMRSVREMNTRRLENKQKYDEERAELARKADRKMAMERKKEEREAEMRRINEQKLKAANARAQKRESASASASVFSAPTIALIAKMGSSHQHPHGKGRDAVPWDAQSVATSSIPLPAATNHFGEQLQKREPNFETGIDLKREMQWTLKHGHVTKGNTDHTVVHRGREGGMDLVTNADASVAVSVWPAAAPNAWFKRSASPSASSTSSRASSSNTSSTLNAQPTSAVSKTCLVCQTHDRNSICLSCFHMSLCEQCAPTTTVCTVCNADPATFKRVIMNW